MAVVEAQKERLRMTIEKEILKHTVEFIKNRLMRCMRDTSTGRTKVMSQKISFYILMTH